MISTSDIEYNRQREEGLADIRDTIHALMDKYNEWPFPFQGDGLEAQIQGEMIAWRRERKS